MILYQIHLSFLIAIQPRLSSYFVGMAKPIIILLNPVLNLLFIYGSR